MGKPRDTKIAILPSTTRKGTTLSTSAALDSPSVIDKLVSPPHASHAGTSAESENSHNIDNVSAVLDDSGSLGSFLDATIAKSRQIENTETPNATTPVKSPELDYSSDDPDEDYVELDDDFIEKCNATTDARKIKKLLVEHVVRYKPSPEPKFATSPINIRDKDYDFSLDLSHIAIVEKTPFCGTEKESAVEHMTELSTLSGVFSDDVKMRTYFVAKIFPFSLKDDAKTWYNNLPPGSIKSPTDLRDVFFRKYFPASAQHAALQRIYNFDQEDGEKLPEAWARFCSLIRAQPDHDLEKHDLLDIFYSGLTIESRAYLDSCAGCVFRKRTPDDAEELLAKIGRNHDDWSTPEPTPTPIVKKRGMIKLNDEDMREAKKSLKEKGIKPEDVKNLPPIEDICETIPPSSMIEVYCYASVTLVNASDASPHAVAATIFFLDREPFLIYETFLDREPFLIRETFLDREPFLIRETWAPVSTSHPAMEPSLRLLDLGVLTPVTASTAVAWRRYGLHGRAAPPCRRHAAPPRPLRHHAGPPRSPRSPHIRRPLAASASAVLAAD
ncbi:hypothetical protein QYE76_043912 [Lolium multiflorum]|uniref:Retrotransposon gag domain-containing protein n=1 Tax=Lolium multiflorum TaxID=4521 RepID=A0AAD8THV1_LOLMU|nr:hypothetical protein QYE76_043912 [Lolium multiflorum]